MGKEPVIHYPQEKRRILALRVSLIEGGISGPFLGLSLDEEKPQDELFLIRELIFVVDKCLLEQCGSIKIDFIEAGNNSDIGRFKITAANPLFSKDDNFSSGPYGSPGLCH